MEESQVVQMTEEQFMEERESPLRELDPILVQNNKEVVQEIEPEDPEALIVARELEELELAQQREHNFQNLDSALKRKQYILSKAKAKEEVEVCTLQNDIYEILETRELTEKDIDSMNELKNDLQVTIEIGALELLKTQKRVENTTTTLTSVKSNYENLEQFEKLISQDITSLDAEYVALVSDYHTGKEAAIQKINANKETIQKTRTEIENFSLKDNTQIEELRKRLEAFLKSEVEEEEALARLNTKHDDCLKEYYNNQLELFKEELECRHLQDMIDNIDLDIIEKQKMNEKAQQDEILDNQMKKLTSANERYMEVENFNKILEDKLEEDSQYNYTLQEKLLSLDNQKVNLISVRQKLQESIDNARLNLKTNQDLNESKIAKVASEISQSHGDIDLISKKKEEAIKQLESLQEDYNNSLHQLESLLKLESEWQEKLQIETQKRREMEGKSLMLEYELKKSKLSLAEVNENIKTIQNLRLVDSQQLTDRLNQTKERRTIIAQDCELKINTYCNERNTYEWNFEETKKENTERNQRELYKLNENVEALEQMLEENNQKMEQLERTMEAKEEERDSLRREIDELRLADLLKKPANSYRRIIPITKGKPLTANKSNESIPNINLDTTTEDESGSEGGESVDMFRELRDQIANLK